MLVCNDQILSANYHLFWNFKNRKLHLHQFIGLPTLVFIIKHSVCGRSQNNEKYRVNVISHQIIERIVCSLWAFFSKQLKINRANRLLTQVLLFFFFCNSNSTWNCFQSVFAWKIWQIWHGLSKELNITSSISNSEISKNRMEKNCIPRGSCFRWMSKIVRSSNDLINNYVWEKMSFFFGLFVCLAGKTYAKNCLLFFLSVIGSGSFVHIFFSFLLNKCQFRIRNDKKRRRNAKTWHFLRF